MSIEVIITRVPICKSKAILIHCLRMNELSVYAFLQSVLKKSIPFWNFDLGYLGYLIGLLTLKRRNCKRPANTVEVYQAIKHLATYAYCDAQNSTHALNVISLRGSDCLVAGVSIVQNYLPEHSVHLSLLTPRTSEVKLKTDPLHNSKWM